jgi:predicted NBD/HSP70 family sugar kinase
MVCNDAFAFANAELAASATAKAGSMLVVLLAEGIGGAIIDDGRVVMGGHGYSGEIGHTIVSAAGRVDTFEMLAGAKLFTRLFEEGQPVADGVQMLLANVGDKAVDAVLDAWVSGLSAGLVNAIHLLDPGRIVLGGPLAGLYPKLSRRIQADIKRRLLAGFAMPEIRVAQFGADGAAIGAAATIRDTLFALPDLETNTL